MRAQNASLMMWLANKGHINIDQNAADGLFECIVTVPELDWFKAGVLTVR